jgi:hypothetical protein
MTEERTGACASPRWRLPIARVTFAMMCLLAGSLPGAETSTNQPDSTDFTSLSIEELILGGRAGGFGHHL